MSEKGDQSHLLNILIGAIENTNEAFVTIDQDHTVIVFNHAAEQMFGYRREEVLGEDLRLILGPSCREGHYRAVERFKKTREPRLIGHETELEVMRKDGELLPATLSFSVAEVGEQLFFTAIIRDMTETRQLQEQVTRAERLAALGQLVAEIGHEIKNPLVLIGGMANQLMAKAEDDKSKGKLRIISGEVMRLEKLLAELRDLYTPKSLALEKIDLNGLLKEVHRLVQEECQQRGIDLSLRLNAAVPFIEGDRSKLHQVFLNLLKNSMEALEAGGQITFGSETIAGGRIQVVISDSGPGIPPEIRKKVFDPFFTTKRKGTGLGLAVSKRIITDHPGSTFELESTEERGTRIIITFPPASPRN